MTSDTDFTGQVVLITGGASGIGWAGAQAFAARGARVAIADLKAEVAEAKAAELVASGLGNGHIGLGGDVSDEDVVDRMVSMVVEKLGQLDVAVSCAGMPDVFAPTLEQSGAQFSRMLDVHLGGTFLVAKRAAAEMIPRGRGAIINISSIAGTHALPMRNGYTAAKHGVIGLTKALGSEWGQSGVRVNAIAPGYIHTPFIARLMEEGKLDGDMLRRRTPMGVLLPPEAIANAMIFLASPLAAMVTATVLTVDGGYTAFGGAGDAASV
jgi:NAD(P)-dependent dehydrogenase (short-subunit alcohol dehydrogenase family)